MADEKDTPQVTDEAPATEAPVEAAAEAPAAEAGPVEAAAEAPAAEGARDRNSG